MYFNLSSFLICKIKVIPTIQGCYKGEKGIRQCCKAVSVYQSKRVKVGLQVVFKSGPWDSHIVSTPTDREGEKE